MDEAEKLATHIAELTNQQSQREHDCNLSVALRLRTVDGGGRSLVRQCTICGRQRGGALKRTDAPADTPAFDVDLESVFHAQRLATYQELQAAEAALAVLIDPELAHQHAEYRASLQADREASAVQLAQARHALDAAIPGVVARMLGGGLIGSSALIKTSDQPHAQQTQRQVPPPYSEDEVFGAQLG